MENLRKKKYRERESMNMRWCRRFSCAGLRRFVGAKVRGCTDALVNGWADVLGTVRAQVFEFPSV